MEKQDKENNIGLKTIGELFGTRFFIPSYQRGYRWTQQQVIDLLNDIKEFNEEKQREFTCVKFVLISGNVFRYFIDRADVNTIEYLYQKYQANKK